MNPLCYLYTTAPFLFVFSLNLYKYYIIDFEKSQIFNFSCPPEDVTSGRTTARIVPALRLNRELQSDQFTLVQSGKIRA